MVYVVLGIFEKKLALCEAEMGTGNEFWQPLSKISRYLEFRIHSCKLHQSTEKVITISHVRETEGLTNYYIIIKYITFSFRQTMTLFEFVALKEIYGFINRIFFIGKACEPANKKQQIIYKITHHGKSSAFFSNIFNLKCNSLGIKSQNKG